MYIQNLIALVYLMAAAIPALFLIRPLAVAHMGEETFARRRNVWLAATALVFVAPNFWVFAVGLMVLAVVASKRERNPIALYALLMLAAPAKYVELPEIAGMRLIPVNGLILLTASLLIPAYIKIGKQSGAPKQNFNHAKSITALVLAYCVAQLFIAAPTAAATVVARRAVELALGTYFVFVIINRLIQTKDELRDVLNCVTLAFFLAAVIGVAEGLVKWLFYAQAGDQWAKSMLGNYIMRQDGLRVTSSADNPITLGHIAALCIVGVVMMYEGVESNAKYKLNAMIAIGLCAIAIYFTRSRAPLITAPICLLVYMAAKPNFSKRLSQLIAAGLVAAIVLMLSPAGAKFIDFLPFVGTVASDAVDYRKAMNAALWNLFLSSPFAGNPNYLGDLEFMRQGQGLIDPLNVYLANAAAFGAGGIIPFALAVLIALRASHKNGQLARKKNDAELNSVNAAILGMTLAHAVFMYTVSFMQTVESVHWILLAMATSLGAIVPKKTGFQKQHV